MESIDRTAVLLDHVVWSCLSGPHSRFAIGDDQAKRYPPDIAMFGAVRPPGLGTSAELATLLQGQSNVAIVAAAVLRPFASGEPSLRVPVDQMLLVEPARLDSVGCVQCNPLAAADVPEMMRLVDATRPGPFAARTIEMGRYIGVRVRGRLVAMGGRTAQGSRLHRDQRDLRRPRIPRPRPCSGHHQGPVRGHPRAGGTSVPACCLAQLERHCVVRAAGVRAQTPVRHERLRLTRLTGR